MRKFLLPLLLLAICCISNSQLKAQQSVGIGTTTPNTEAILDLDPSSPLGLLMPRLPLSDTGNFTITAANDGMIFYATDINAFVYFNISDSLWTQVGSGAGGGTGADGLTSLITATPEAPGVNCAEGGQRIDIGLDDNDDGTLDPGEIDNTFYVCNGADGFDGDRYATTSTTSLTIGLGAQSLTVDTGLAYTLGQTVIIAEPGLNSMEGSVTSYNPATGAMNVNVTNVNGGGTFASWDVNLAGAPGPAGTDGLNSLSTATPEPAGINCSNGGQFIEVGLDDNADGTLDPGEVDYTFYICDGDTGVAGTDGIDGLNSLSTATPEPAGINCNNGGQFIEVGLDDNADGALDPGEVDYTYYICDGDTGVAGVDGIDGLNSLSTTTPEPAGVNCSNGGQFIEVGLDDNADGTLDPGEVDYTYFVCNGDTGVAGTDGLDGDRYATTSTTSLTIGLGAQSLTVDTGLAYTLGQTVIIAEPGLNSMEGSVTSYNPATGAMNVNVTNVNGGGTFASWDVNLAGAPGPAGTDGLNSLSTATPEPAGINCSNGGQFIEVGLDDNADGTLDPGEVDYTFYICDGDTGVAGTDGIDGLNSLSTATPEPAGVNCSNGGQFIEVGLDDNADGALDPGEVDYSYYLCDGDTGVAGLDGNTILSGNGAPAAQGVDGDFYLDTASVVLYGPKASGLWPLSGDTLPGADGQDGNTVLNGTVDPTNPIGNDGDFYINTVTDSIFGPKAGTWPPGEPLVRVGGANDTIPANVFSAHINNFGTATLISESYPFIQSVSRISLGRVEITYVPGFFTQAPSVLATTRSGGFMTAMVDDSFNDAVSVQVITRRTDNGLLEDRPFNLIVQRQGLDYQNSLTAPPNVVGYWQSNGTDIYFDTARVGIGTSSVTSSLTIANLPGHEIEITGGGNSSLQTDGQFDINSTTFVNVQGNFGTNLSSGGTDLRVSGAGVSIGNGTPFASGNASLELNDSDKGLQLNRVDRASLTLAAVDRGMTVYDSTTNELLVWDGAAWISATAGSSPTLQSAYDGGQTINMGSGNIDFISSGANSVLYIDEANERVGIGNTSPTYSLDILNTASASAINAVTNFNAARNEGINSLVSGSASENFGISGRGVGGTLSIGVNGEASNASSSNIGVRGVGFNTVNTGWVVGVQGEVQGVTTATNAYGFNAVATATGATNNVGVNATASGATNNYGIYSTATGGTSNYAGYFENGDVVAENGNVGIGTTTPANKLEVIGDAAKFDSVIIANNAQAGYVLTAADATGAASWQQLPGSTAWDLLGNAGTVDGTNFIGTTDLVPLNFRVNNIRAGRLESGGAANTFFGNSAGIAANSNINATGIGAGALSSLTSGDANTAIGLRALNALQTGTGNVAIGYNTYFSSTTGIDNVSIGYSAMSGASGDRNVGVGAYSAQNLSGFNNTALGYQAMPATGSRNGNTAIGFRSLLGATSGDNNVALGLVAGQTITTGSDNTFIGSGTDASSNNLTNATAIGANTIVGQDNSLILGNNALVGIGTSTPNANLSIEGNTPGFVFEEIANLDPDGTVSLDFVNDVNRMEIRYEGSNFANNSLVIFDDNASQARLTIDDVTGNVGIGDYSADEKLDITDSVAAGWVATQVENLAADGIASYDLSTDIGYFGIGTDASGVGSGLEGDFYVANYNLGSTPLVITDSDNIGIGTTTPSNKLEVVGDAAKFDSVIIVNGAQTGYVLTSNATGEASWQPLGASTFWDLTGNAGTVDGTNFLGTTDDVPLNFRMNNQPSGRIENSFSGNANTGIGYQAGNNGAGVNNSAFGFRALTSNTADGNAAFGSIAMENAIGGGANTALGYATLRNSTGTQNTAVGNAAMENSTTADNNVAVGFLALLGTDSDGNTAIGSTAMQNSTTGNSNVAVGFASLLNNNADANTAVGAGALLTNNTGSGNTAVGERSLTNNDGGQENTALGLTALFGNTSGNQNTGLGFDALFSNTTGGQNVGIGWRAGFDLNGGSNNVFIGYDANAGNVNINNSTAIGYNAVVSQDNSMVLGDTGNISVGIGTSAPQGDFHIVDDNVVMRIQSTGTNTLASYEIQFGRTDGIGNFVQTGEIGTPGSGDYFQMFSPNNLHFNAGFADRLIIGSGGTITLPDFAGSGRRLLTVNNSGLVGSIDLSDSVNWARNGNDIYNTNTGGVGIGTTTPTESLEIANGGLFISGASNNLIRFNTAGFANPALTTRSVGAKIVLWPELSATSADFALGVGLNTQWYGVPNSGDAHRFYAGTSELMTIEGGGNVGIGTASPNAPLQFANNLGNRKIVLYESFNNDHQFYGFGVNSSEMRYQVSGNFADHVFYAAASAASDFELMRIEGTGNVGIGTNNPLARLHINSGGSAVPLRLDNTVAGNTIFDVYNNGVLGTRYQTTSTSTNIISQSNRDLQLWTNSGAGLIMDGTTRDVGIGISPAFSKLNVNGDIYMYNNALIATSTSTDIPTSANVDHIYHDDGANAWNFVSDLGYKDPGNSTLNAGLINMTGTGDNYIAGNLGIGSTTPTVKLEVNDVDGNTTGTSGVLMRLKNSATGLGATHTGILFSTYVNAGVDKAGIFFRRNQGFGIGDMLFSTNNTFDASTVDASNSFIRMILTSDGDVGIGTTVPNTRLHVNGAAGQDPFRVQTNGSSKLVVFQDGTVTVNQFTDQAYDFYVNGSAAKNTGTTWINFSDKRLKNIEGEYNEGLAIIRQIQPVWFKYNGKGGIEPSKKPQVGIVAQDLQKVAPYTVSKVKTKLDSTDTHETEVLSFDFNAINYAQINAIKELADQVDLLKEELALKNKEIENLQGHLDSNSSISKKEFESLKAKNVELEAKLNKIIELMGTQVSTK